MVTTVVTARPQTTIESAIKTLYEKHVGSIVVTDEEDRCKGIFTERDAIRVIAGNVSQKAPIEAVMTQNPIAIRETASYAEAMSLIVSHGVRHLPVTDNDNQVVGILSIRNFLDEVVGITHSKL